MNYVQELIRIFFNSFVSWCVCLKKLDSKKIIITSTRNISYNFNSKYFYEFLTRSPERYDFDVYYVINNKKKRQELNQKYKTNRFIESASLSGALFCLNAKYWVSSTFELPVNSLHCNKNRVVMHLGHGVPLKKIGLNEENIPFLKRINRIIRTRQFTDIVCYSEKLKNDMVKTFANPKANYVALGQPRNDSLLSDNQLIRDKLREITKADVSAKFILYAPTWRPYATTKFFPFNIDAYQLENFLKKNNIFVLTRSHPFYPSFIDDDLKLIPNIINFNSSVAPEINDYLAGFDALITDYSSIYIDFLVMGRKVAFIPYDYAEYKEKVGFCYPYEKFTPGMKIMDSNDLELFLTSDDTLYSNERADIMKITNTKAVGNCAEIAEYLKDR